MIEFKLSDNCPLCKKKQTKIVRLNNGIKSQTTTLICENKECTLYINIDKVKNWEKLENNN